MYEMAKTEMGWSIQYSYNVNLGVSTKNRNWWVNPKPVGFFTLYGIHLGCKEKTQILKKQKNKR